MTRLVSISTALLSVFLTLSVSAKAQSHPTAIDPNASACGADTTHPPVKSFARGFTGGWSPVSDDERSTPKWGQTAALWPREGGGTFVQLWMLDEPTSASWSERIDYCFAADGRVLWIDARYNRLEADSRNDHFEFNPSGTVTRHTEQCLNPSTEETRPADEACKDANAFLIIKRLENFPFLKRK